MTHIQFGDYEQSNVNYNSTWRKKKLQTENSTQTSVVLFSERAIQTARLKAKEVQTDVILPQDASKVTFEYIKLVAFLSSVESQISKILLKNITSTAFQGYSVQWEKEIDSVSCLHELRHQGMEGDMCCTEVCWNKSGSVIAGCFGHLDHQSWCTHKGVLCAWNIVLKGLNHKKASTVIETNSCLSSISFHPHFNFIIAGGTFNGEILIWDINQEEDPLIANTKLDQNTFEEPVAKLAWIPSERHQGYDIAAISNDGKIVVWNAEDRLKSAVKGAQLLLKNIPKSVRGGLSTSQPTQATLGGTSISFSKENHQDYLVGTEAGYIFKCNFGHATDFNVVRMNKDTPLANPITFPYNPHSGPVEAIAWSPFHRNVFLTCGSDGDVRLYNLLQSMELLALEPSPNPILDIKWSYTRPAVFAISSADGFIFIYDLMHDHRSPFVVLPPTQKPYLAVTSLAFNLNKPQFFASGDSHGIIKVWQLSSYLEKAQDMEDILIDKLGKGEYDFLKKE